MIASLIKSEFEKIKMNLRKEIREIRTFIATLFFSIVLMVNGVINIINTPNPYGFFGYVWFGWVSVVMGVIIFAPHLFRKKK